MWRLVMWTWGNWHFFWGIQTQSGSVQSRKRFLWRTVEPPPPYFLVEAPAGGFPWHV